MPPIRSRQRPTVAARDDAAMLRAYRVDISVIIPAFNEEKLLPETLAAVNHARAAWTPLGWASEVVVCDNNSTDHTGDVARAAGARVIFEPVNMIARARNAGASISLGRWLLFVDADSRPSPELFASAARAIQSGRVIAGGSVVRLDDESRLELRMVTGLWNRISRWNRWMAGSFIFVDAAAFREIGGFSAQMYAGEELDLSQRLKAHGRKSGRKLVILRDAPLVTSARKARLYSRAELGSMLARAVFRPRATMTSREACSIWYDGRR
jgi:glycosyltransferase involved in cell wall biosynthesis